MNATTHSINWPEVKRRLQINRSAAEDDGAEDRRKLAEVFHHRFLQLAGRRTPAGRSVTTRPTLVFLVGSQRYGIELAAVTEVLSLPRCTGLPAAPPELLGVINLRGEIRPILELSRLLELPERQEPTAGYVVVAHGESLKFGLRVDQLERIEHVAMESLLRAGDEWSGPAARLVQGVTPQRLAVLDVHELLAHPIFQSGLSEHKGTEHDHR